MKLVIAKRLPIWSLVKAQSYERTPVPQATACFWVLFVVPVIVIVKVIVIVIVRNRTFYGVIRTRRSIDKWLTVSFFKFFGLQQFGVLQAIPSYVNKKNQIKFNRHYWNWGNSERERALGNGKMKNGSKKRIGNEMLAFKLGFVPIFHFSRSSVLVPRFSNIQI